MWSQHCLLHCLVGVHHSEIACTAQLFLPFPHACMHTEYHTAAASPSWNRFWIMAPCGDWLHCARPDLVPHTCMDCRVAAAS